MRQVMTPYAKMTVAQEPISLSAAHELLAKCPRLGAASHVHEIRAVGCESSGSHLILCIASNGFLVVAPYVVEDVTTLSVRY